MKRQWRAYKNNPKLRAAFLKQMKWHQREDRLVQRIYEWGRDDPPEASDPCETCERTDGRHFKWCPLFDPEDIIDGFHGCLIGCAVHSLAKICGAGPGILDRRQFLKDQLGIPVELTQLADAVYEGISLERAKAFALRFPSAIRCGADLRTVVPQFVEWALKENSESILHCAYRRDRGHLDTIALVVGIDRLVAKCGARAVTGQLIAIVKKAPLLSKGRRDHEGD